MTAALIIPALNEEASLRSVLASLPAQLFTEVIVVDNGSTDGTSRVAREAGAKVVSEPRRGYGSACLAGIAALSPDAKAIVFMDADGSDVPAEAKDLLEPIVRDQADLVIGSRVLGTAERGALSSHQRFGNAVAVWLVRLMYGRRYTDLGPFRAIRRSALERLGMKDRDFGWTMEMQVKALQANLRILERPVSYRRRQAGRSKVSGNFWGSLAAGVKILWTVARYASMNGGA